jgi:hypothetical protein
LLYEYRVKEVSWLFLYGRDTPKMVRFIWPCFVGAETTLSKVQKSSLLLTYEVNAIGPILVVKVCHSNFMSIVWQLKIKIRNGHLPVISFLSFL